MKSLMKDLLGLRDNGPEETNPVPPVNAEPAAAGMIEYLSTRRVRGWAQRVGDKPANVSVYLNGQRIASALADKMRQVVESHPAVKRCVDVELSDRHNRIHAHVVAQLAGDVSLEQAHQVETELEELIRRALPEVHEVTARATA